MRLGFGLCDILSDAVEHVGYCTLIVSQCTKTQSILHLSVLVAGLNFCRLHFVSHLCLFQLLLFGGFGITLSRQFCHFILFDLEQVPSPTINYGTQENHAKCAKYARQKNVSQT